VHHDCMLRTFYTGAGLLTKMTMIAMTQVGKDEPPPPPLLGLLFVLPALGLLFVFRLLLLSLGDGELPPLLAELLAVTMLV
jgi:hypothetical protein